jgi:hypothetical protein
VVVLPFTHLELVKRNRVGWLFCLHEFRRCVKSPCSEVHIGQNVSSADILLAELSIEGSSKQVFLLKAFHVDSAVRQVQGLQISPQCKSTFKDTANEVEARVVPVDSIEISLNFLVSKILLAGLNATHGYWVQFSTFASNLLVVCPTSYFLVLLPVDLRACTCVSQPLAMVVDGRRGYGRVLDRPDRRKHQRVDWYVLTFRSA